MCPSLPKPTALAKRERDCLVSIRSDYGQCLASGSVFRWNSPALLAAPPATARGVSGVARGADLPGAGKPGLSRQEAISALEYFLEPGTSGKLAQTPGTLSRRAYGRTQPA